MRYTLKDYQKDAVASILRNISRAQKEWYQSRYPGAFSLTATTGAGKTVMAAAVIEALFYGKPSLNFKADENAVVLWFTDDPSLNEQTRFRLLDASDRLTYSSLITIESNFSRKMLDSGTIYFLNRQKLSKTSRLVKGHSVVRDVDQIPMSMPMPDGREFSIWNTLANTIESSNRTLYLVLDEAHRGMRPSKWSDQAARRDMLERTTIVQRLVNGANGVPPIPIVWGISATIERFNDAMDRASSRTTYPHVQVDPVRVQESGLLKDDIRLSFPVDQGHFDTVFLNRAAEKAKDITERWMAYLRRERLPADAVVPLLVVQVPNKPSDHFLATVLSTIQRAWPEVTGDAVAHVFGDHSPIKIGGTSIPYIRPQCVEDRTDIRVLLAKDAISTGWDCPRAEVLVSFRSARDRTHIMQLLGRMVRTPLARRVPGDDVLNAVACVLPSFDRNTATEVAMAMVGDRVLDADGTGGGNGRRVLLKPVDMERNGRIPAVVWRAFDEIPSEMAPRGAFSPVRRLSALAHELSRDGLMKGARREAYRRMFAKLDGMMVQYGKEVESAAREIREVRGEMIAVRNPDGRVMEHRSFVVDADFQSVKAHFGAAKRVFSGDLAHEYASHLARPGGACDEFSEAYIKIAALARVEHAQDDLDSAADAIAKRWFEKFRVQIRSLTDERRTSYDDIWAMSSQPQAKRIRKPRIRTEDGAGDDGEWRGGHLMADKRGLYPIHSLNVIERQVLDQEMARPNFLAWYRNPSRPSADALVVAYQDGQGDWRSMCPDFLFFHGDERDVKVSIVDPHGYHLADSLHKLRGLAEFVSKYSESFDRVEAVSGMRDETLRVLDVTAASVREAIAEWGDAKALYLSDLALKYVVDG